MIDLIETSFFYQIKHKTNLNDLHLELTVKLINYNKNIKNFI